MIMGHTYRRWGANVNNAIHFAVVHQTNFAAHKELEIQVRLIWVMIANVHRIAIQCTLSMNIKRNPPISREGGSAAGEWSTISGSLIREPKALRSTGVTFLGSMKMHYPRILLLA